MRRWWIKFSSWEYWPIWAVYAVPALYYLYLALRARSFFFFSAANPGIETGGMYGESKNKIYQLLPMQHLPITVFIPEHFSLEDMEKAVEENGLQFPLIAKPDLGERGWEVTILKDAPQLRAYKNRLKVDFIAQELVVFPQEMSLFYFRMPGAAKGRISSLTNKELLQVTGDGVQTLEALILAKPRAFLQWEVLRPLFQNRLEEVPAAGEKVELMPFGNHCRGAMFLDFNAYIDTDLTAVFDEIALQIPGFYFGRFDLRCQSIDDLKQGKNFKILELNGVAAEPAHIYQPGFPFWQGQKSIMQHYRWIYDIAVENHRLGQAYMNWKEAKYYWNRVKDYRAKVTSALQN